MSDPSAPPALAPWMDFPSLVPEVPSTPSSELQHDAARECLPFLLGHEHLVLADNGLPALARPLHLRFLQGSLGTLPAGFAALDASRPWMLYWALNGLSLLGHDVTAYRQRLVHTLAPMQNAGGGFGGSHGQLSHLATSYASVLALLIVGGRDALDLVDRTAMWHWLGSLKHPDGDFHMCNGGERDVRGSYCALTIVVLLNLPNALPASSPARRHGHDSFDSGLGRYIASCQTYEGGIGSTPAAEAHGAYTFCALACLCLVGDPAEMMRKHLDLDSLMSWLVKRQHAPEGGLAGRSNKLVDGCYSHWIGGCWPLVSAALATPHTTWNEYALRKYILCCCQGPRGGLRDKPSKPVDAYHSCYNLAGLGAAGQRHSYTKPRGVADAPLDAAFHWKCDTGEGRAEQSVRLMHPVFVIPADAVGQARAYYSARPLQSG